MSKNRFWTNHWVLYAVILILVIGYLGFSYYLRRRPVTTVILVRHAEKTIEPTNPNPALSPAGQERAQTPANMLSNTGVTAIYVTQFMRTQWTAAPLADRLKLKANQIEAGNVQEVVRQIKSNHAGGVVLVAGHNNSVPAIISALGGGTYPIIPENEYDNMFVVTIYGPGKVRTVRLEYGNPSPAADAAK